MTKPNEVTAEVFASPEIYARVLKNTKLAALGEISAGMAHEINNPLTVIQGRCYQLQQMVENKKSDEKVMLTVADSILKAADKIAKLVGSMRAFAHDSDQGALELISVAELIESSLDFCRTRFHNHGIEVRVNEIPQDLEIECRIIPMEQVILNLLYNAHDAVISRAERWIEISANKVNEEIEIIIKDSGAGVATADENKIFQPFFTTKEHGSGIGLGLTIAEKIAENHNGKLTYRRGEHTEFVLKLPCA